MLDVKFYDTIDDALLKFAVVISQRIFTIQSVFMALQKSMLHLRISVPGCFLYKML